MTMGSLWNYSNRCTDNDYDGRSLSTSGCFVLFTHLIFIGFGVRDVLARCWQASQSPLLQKEPIPIAIGTRLQIKKHFDLHQG
jgi:hypothetical protein